MSTKPSPAATRRLPRDVGAVAEQAAVEFLKQQGFRIVAVNWRCRKGEVDIIAEEAGTLVFVEVKSRRSTSHGSPGEAVNWTKQSRIVHAAAMYAVQKHLTERPMRFDVVELLIDSSGAVRSTQLWRSAFVPRGPYQVL